MIRRVALLVFLLLPFGPIFAQEEETAIYQPKFEFGLYTGTLLLAQIPEVIDNVPPVVLKLGMNSSIGFVEASLLHARGNDMRWRSGMLDYRFNLDDLQIPFHALFGFQADMYQKYDGEQEFYGGGWHYGGGAHLEVIPHLFLRADFVNRFGPGRSLLVLVGLSVGIGDFEKDNGQ
jgi:hypothetical protein